MNTNKPTKQEAQVIEELEEKAEELYDDEEYEQAVETYRKAAEMGGSYAQYSLGFCYKNGQGAEEDLEEAMKWYKIAAENGNEQAMFELALCLFEECEYRTSFDWFAKAAEAGEDDAWYYLGWLYFNGEGPEYSPDKAEKCWSKVTNENQSDLQYKIGHSYDCWRKAKKACDETERNKRFEKAAYWMQLAANHGNDSAKKWLKENKAGVAESCQTASGPSAETPSFMNFWNALIEIVDGHSGLVFSPDSDLSGTTLISNEYLYKDWFFVFSYFESKGMLVSLVIDTDSTKDNNAIANTVNKYLKDNKISTKILNTVSDGKGRTVVLAVDGLDMTDASTYASAIKRIAVFVSWVESAWEEIGDAIIQRQKPPLVKIEPENGKSVEYKYDWGKKIHNNVLFRYGSLLIESDISLRDEVLGSLTRDGKSTCMNDWEIVDEDAGDSVSDEWVFPDNEFGQEAEELYDEDGEEGLESLGLEGTRDMIFFYGPLNVQFMGFPLDPGKTPNLQWSKEMYAPPRTIPSDLFEPATQPSKPKTAEAPNPKPIIKAVGSDTKKTSVSVAPSGSTNKLDFWQAFKPYIDQMRHTEFSKVKIKDDDCLDAKPTVIPGVYNSILMRASKKLLRLELYIDTAEEAKNLEIIDHIKTKMKVPAALKGRIEYERKEGRRAQRVCVSFPDFELSDRSCWAAYMQDILSVADDFFDALEAQMRELIKP